METTLLARGGRQDSYLPMQATAEFGLTLPSYTLIRQRLNLLLRLPSKGYFDEWFYKYHGQARPAAGPTAWSEP